MDVVHVSTVHSPFDTRIFQKEARTLAQAGHNVSILVHHDRREVRDGVTIEPLGEYSTRAERLLHHPRVYAKATRLNADVYHFHDVELLPIAKFLSWRLDAKIVYDVHEQFDNVVQHRDWIPAPLKPVLSRIIVPSQSILARGFDGLVAASDWIAKPFEERNHTVHIVRNLPITENITFEDISHEREHEHILVYVGSLDADRGLRSMLEVTNELVNRGYDVGLWIIGTFASPQLQVETNSYIEQNGLSGNVRFWGYVDYLRMFSHLRAADVGLMLVQRDRYEFGFSNKMFEYLYAGLPIVATSTISTRKFIPDDCGELVDTEKVEDQADAVERLLNRQDEFDKIGECAQQYVESQFTWEQESTKLLSLYDTL